MKTSSIAVETWRSTTQSDSIPSWDKRINVHLARFLCRFHTNFTLVNVWTDSHFKAPKDRKWRSFAFDRCEAETCLKITTFGSKVRPANHNTNFLLNTVEPRLNEVPRDWGNWFVISRVRYIEVLFHTLRYYWTEKYRSLYRGIRYIEVR